MCEPVFLREGKGNTTLGASPQDLLVACSKVYDVSDHISTDCDTLSKEQLKLLLRACEKKNKCLERIVEELRLAFDREFRIKLGQKLGRVLPPTITSPKRVVPRDNPTPRLSYKCAREENKEDEEDEEDEDDGSESSDEWFDIFRFR
jgi:hypothetical protein